MPLILLKSNTAYADYYRDSGFTFNYGTQEGFHVSGIVTVPDNAIYLQVNSITPSDITRLQYAHGNQVNTGSYSSPITISGGTQIDVSQLQGEQFRVRVWKPQGTGVAQSTMTDSDIVWILPGSDPDLGVKSQEQRYNTTTFYSADFTKSNSLPLIYTGSLYLSDFTPNGNCNSIQVDASTVGGDQLEWRLNLGQSGIDGQTAWLPIGFKMPIQVNQFSEHSIQLRMPDPDNPGQYYDLQPSELSMCSVTYGYMADVYMSLQPGEYQELPTVEMPTMPNYELPTMPNVAEYVQAPVSVLSTVFSWLSGLPHIAVLIGVLAFAFIVKVIIW